MITSDQLQAIADKVRGSALDDDLVPALREAFPGIHFTFCMEDDIGEIRPAMEAEGFNLYYVDGHDHCLKFTPDAGAATGIVVAEVLDEE